MVATTPWLREETDHFVFYYLDQIPKEKAESLIEAREEAYEKISDYLDVELDTKINFYFFPSQEIGLKLLEGLSPNQALPGIYTIFSRMQQTAGHELTHVLAYYMTDKHSYEPKVLSEGLAVFLDQTDRDYHAVTKELIEEGAEISLAELLDSNSELYKSENQGISYPAAASFVGFLIDTYGLDKFKEAWSCGDEHVVDTLEKIYEETVDSLESAWSETAGFTLE